MKLFAWVPGILGSRLERRADRAEIWPPSPGAVNGLADRTFAELTDDLIATKVIDQVCIVPVYSPLDHMFVRAGIADYQPGQRPEMARLPFGYDWRLDVQSQAALLAEKLNAATVDGDEIVMVAHSMGNYLCRLLIETTAFDGPFRSRVKKIVSVNGPHAGAPIIVARMMGLDKMDHIVWADVPKLLATAPFAGALDLLPAPGRPGLFNGDAPIDIYDPTVVQYFRWGSENIDNARQFWAALGAQQRADDVEYVIVRSYLDDDMAGQSTIADVRWDGAHWVVEKGPGDGDVPPWSCEALGPADIVLPGEHLGVFDTERFATDVFEPHIAPFVDMDFLAVPPSIKLQPVRRDITAGAEAEFALVQDRGDQAEVFDGVVTWLPLTVTGAVDPSRKPFKDVVHVDAMKAATVVKLDAPQEPGPYRVVLQGSADGHDLGDNPAASVVVVAPKPAAQPPRPPA